MADAPPPAAAAPATADAPKADATEDKLGELRIRVSHALGVAAEAAFIRVEIANGFLRKDTFTAQQRLQAAVHRWDDDLRFQGSIEVFTATPLVVSGWAKSLDGTPPRQIGIGRVDLGALITTMHGVLCGIPMENGQVFPPPARTLVGEIALGPDGVLTFTLRCMVRRCCCPHTG